MEILKFALSSFWTWTGTVILIVVAAGAVGQVIENTVRALRPQRTVTVTKPDGTTVTISGAGAGDVDRLGACDPGQDEDWAEWY